MRLVVSILLTLCLLPAAFFALYACVMVPFLFDAPGTEDQVATWTMAGAVLSLPFTFLGALVGVWLAVVPGRSGWWYLSLALPVASLLVFWVAGSFRPGFF